MLTSSPRLASSPRLPIARLGFFVVFRSATSAALSWFQASGSPSLHVASAPDFGVDKGSPRPPPTSAHKDPQISPNEIVDDVERNICICLRIRMRVAATGSGSFVFARRSLSVAPFGSLRHGSRQLGDIQTTSSSYFAVVPSVHNLRDKIAPSRTALFTDCSTLRPTRKRPPPISRFSPRLSASGRYLRALDEIRRGRSLQLRAGRLECNLDDCGAAEV